ncbi:MAG TPA: hypothetical protein VL614_18225 [Acetobacteraceae bacterium]|jgi:hypothetical protein|nr:hypothetical protein [Acetobacteraceae bacterium]
MTGAQATLLRVAFRNPITEPSVEAGYARFHTLDADAIDYASFCDAIASCLRDGLIREPIRLPEGALQCHWHLELTPKGVQAARAISGKDD